MNDHLKRHIVSHPFFHSMAPEHLKFIVDSGAEAVLPANAFLFREGEPANALYIILDGSIALEAHEPGTGTALIQTLGPGDVFGWSCLLEPFVWHLQARALQSTRLIMLNGAHLLVEAERDHDFGYDLMKRISHLLLSRLQATRRQLFHEQLGETIVPGSSIS